MPEAPSIVVTIGLHGSASTWVFNVARELKQLECGTSLKSGFADNLSAAMELFGSGLNDVVIKSHRGDAVLDRWIKNREAKIILSIRDPRDAALSMARRFQTPLSFTVRWVFADCLRMSSMIGRGHPLFRYEDRFFEKRQSLEMIAHHLGLSAFEEAFNGIFEQFTASSVRALASSLADKPRGEVDLVGRFRMDPHTQVLEGHIGDGRSEKWRDLDEGLQRRLTEYFADYLALFGYSNDCSRSAGPR